MPKSSGLDPTVIEHRSRHDVPMLLVGDVQVVSIPQSSSIDRDASSPLTVPQRGGCLDRQAIEHRSRRPGPSSPSNERHSSRSHSHRASIATRKPWPLTSANSRSLDPTVIEHRSRRPGPSSPSNERHFVSIPQSSSIDRDPAATCASWPLFRSRSHSHRASIATIGLRRHAQHGRCVSIPQPSSIDRDPALAGGCRATR